LKDFQVESFGGHFPHYASARDQFLLRTTLQYQNDGDGSAVPASDGSAVPASDHRILALECTLRAGFAAWPFENTLASSNEEACCGMGTRGVGIKRPVSSASHQQLK
jgi:hypothetical protein